MSGKSLFVLMIASILLSLALAGCGTTLHIGNVDGIIGSGKAATRDYALSGFTRVSIDSAFVANITRGETYKVSVTTDDNLLDSVSVANSGGTLTVRRDMTKVRSITPRAGSTVDITMPELQAVKLNGASRANIAAGFQQTAGFDANLDGATNLTGDMQASDFQVRMNGASQCTLTGAGASLMLDANGASRAKLGGLSVDRANVRMNGASSAAVNASTSLDYNLDGASQLTYTGSPALGSARTEGASRAQRQ